MRLYCSSGSWFCCALLDQPPTRTSTSGDRDTDGKQEHQLWSYLGFIVIMVIPSSLSENVTSFRELTLGALVWNNSGIATHGKTVFVLLVQELFCFRNKIKWYFLHSVYLGRINGIRFAQHGRNCVLLGKFSVHLEQAELCSSFEK